MKASYHWNTFEVDSIIGKDGMEYPAQDVVLVEPDWSSFRREAAKEILAGMLSCSEHIFIDNKKLITIEGYVNGAIMIADTLIAKLKEK